MSQGQVNDIKNNTLADVTVTGHWHHDFQFLQLTVLQFSERKNRFREDCSCFLDNANSHQALQYNNITVSKNDFLRYSYSITVLRNGIFLVASQEIICNSGRQQTKSLTKILDENALEYLASRKGFILDRLRLDILTIIFTRIFNYNLSVISVCSVDFF